MSLSCVASILNKQGVRASYIAHVNLLPSTSNVGCYSEDINTGLYPVDGSLHPRKDLQLVKGNVIKIIKLNIH